MVNIKNIITSFFDIFTIQIKKLEKNSRLLEKKYNELKKEDKENKILNKELKKSNTNLKKLIKTAEKELQEIYEHRFLEEKEKDRKKMEQLERKITGGIAHKLKNLYNPLFLTIDKVNHRNSFEKIDSSLSGLLKLLKKNTAAKELAAMLPLFNELNESHKQLKEIFTISRQAIEQNIDVINIFVRYSELKKHKTSIALDKVIDKVVHYNRVLLDKEHITVAKKYTASHHITGGQEQFFLLFQNLLLNSVKAVKKKKKKSRGRITVTIYTAADKQKKVILFQDNGTGIPAAGLNNIFNFFFTTDPDQGSGIGLSFCKKIIELYNGTITVASRLHRGTTFKITLPQED
ncbi:MAG TPA: sensor histidine kinase [Spirochaetota bacterium]|nr:sensor histidine kinase [Spirochaetota bacterium]